MINRILLRIKVIQLLYSYYQNTPGSTKKAEKELMHSIEKSYELFHLLFLLITAITDFAEARIEKGKNKFRPTEEERNPNPKFILNRFVKQLRANRALNDYAKVHKLTWAERPELIKALFDQILVSEIYQEYMSDPVKSYESDKRVWYRLFARVILVSPALDEALEELDIFWNNELDITGSFIVKIIKRFEETAGVEQKLFPMFKDEADREFVSTLFTDSIHNGKLYRTIIDQNAKNWEADRIALMDTIIMQAALSELLNFPTIPANVTLNEFIELAKCYSTERSGSFVNGVLNNVVNDLREKGQLLKAVSL